MRYRPGFDCEPEQFHLLEDDLEETEGLFDVGKLYGHGVITQMRVPSMTPILISFMTKRFCKSYICKAFFVCGSLASN